MTDPMSFTFFDKITATPFSVMVLFQKLNSRWDKGTV